MKNTHVTKCDPFTNKVQINLYMFSALVVNGVGREINSCYIVTIDDSRLVKRKMKLSQELGQPAGFSDGICNTTVPSFGTRARDCVLPFRRPRD